METCNAILVKKTRWSESSLIITWLTDSFGTIQTSARGALRPKHPLASKLDLFYNAEISFDLAKKEGALHSLREVSLLQTYSLPNYSRLTAASHCASLAALTTPPMQPAHETYSLLSRALAYFRDNDPSPRTIQHFEVELTKILGIWDSTGKISPHTALDQLCGKTGRDLFL